MSYSNYGAVVFVDGKRRLDYEDTNDCEFHARIPLFGTDVDLVIYKCDWDYIDRDATPDEDGGKGHLWLDRNQELYAILAAEHWRRGHDDFWWLKIKHFGPPREIAKLGFMEKVRDWNFDVSISIHPGCIGWRSRLQYWWDFRRGKATGGGAWPKNGRDVPSFALLDFKHDGRHHLVFFGPGIMPGLCPASRIEELDVRTLGGNARDFWGGRFAHTWPKFINKTKAQ